MRSKFKWILTLILTLSIQAFFAQEKTITGIVSDELGPIVGANVVIKGTTKGTSTDFDGKYTISAKTGDVIVISYVGKNEQEITVGTSNTYNVSLKDGVALQEVVVIGAMGIKRKPDESTTSTQLIKSEELNQANNPNAVQALAGKVSGLQINTTSTGLTPNTSIILRGQRSISGNNSALVVIDNVISSAAVLSIIDPNNIESINVLKGANAAALYGEKGSAGAIIVTTKKGSKDNSKFTIDVNSSLTFEEIAFLPETQNRYGQGWQGDFDWTDQGSWGPEYDGSTQVVGTPYPNVGDWRFFTYEHIEDNYKPFFNTGITQQNTLTLSSGSLESGYINFSVNRQDVKGLIPNDIRNKNFYSLSAGKTAGKFTLSTVVRYSNDKTDRADGSLFATLANTAGNVNVEAFNSGDNYDHWTLYDDSPYWLLKNSRSNSSNEFTELLGEAQYKLNDNISAVLRSSVRNNTVTSLGYNNGFLDLLELTGTSRTVRSFYSTSQGSSRNIYTDFLVNLDYKLTDNIGLQSNFGLNATDSKSYSLTSGGSDLTIPGYYDLSNVANVQSPSESKFRQRTVGAFANVDLSYKNYFFVNLTGRNDSNSALPNKSYFYPSAGISFIPTKAFESLKGKILSKAKVSASIVKVGNVNALSAHSIDQTGSQAGGYPYFLTPNNSFLVETSVVDPNIRPEFVNSNEFNLNLEFLDVRGPRITLDASAAFQKITDQMLNITTSNATGFASALINVGETKSKSFELDLGFTPIKTDNFTWKGNVSYSTFDTEVVKVTDQSDRVGSGSPGIYAVEGQSFPVIMGTAYTRDDQGRVVLGSNGAPVRSSSLEVLGKTTPDYILNFGTEFKYKGIRLSAIADYRTGHVFYSGVNAQLSGQGRTIESAQNGREPFIFPNSTIQGSGVTNTSVTSGGSGSYASYQTYITDNYGFFDENFVLDATAFKLREVSLSYDFPSSITSRLKLARLNFGISGRNLLTILPKENRGYNDPETGSGLAGYSFTPPTQFYSFNVNLTF